jgi:hypothetical protein
VYGAAASRRRQRPEAATGDSRVAEGVHKPSPKPAR